MCCQNNPEFNHPYITPAPKAWKNTNLAIDPKLDSIKQDLSLLYEGTDVTRIDQPRKINWEIVWDRGAYICLGFLIGTVVGAAYMYIFDQLVFANLYR
jgi:hypothetical protein